MIMYKYSILTLLAVFNEGEVDTHEIWLIVKVQTNLHDKNSIFDLNKYVYKAYDLN